MALFVINRCVDLGFILDIGFTFFVPFTNARGGVVLLQFQNSIDP
jgi:hypothetical protein